MKKNIFTLVILISIVYTSNAQNWLTTGNIGTTPSNFLETTDAQSLRFKVKNQLSGIIDSALGNAGFVTYHLQKIQQEPITQHLALKL